MAANPEDVQGKSDDPSVLLGERVRSIVQRLEKEADDRVSRRQQIEERWLDDLEQFHGRYDPATDASLKDAKKSRLFINQTRAKTNAMEARLSDMLFPTDDKNWGIGPTPVPELTVQAEEVARAAANAKLSLKDNPNDPALAAQADQATQASALLQAQLDEARKRSRLMEEEIDDHLRECRYSIQAREVIRDACKLGTGIMKGPISDGRSRRSWARTGQNVFEIKYAEDKRPVYWRTDPWNFFPDMDAATIEESESNFERHLFNKKQLRALARQPGFDKDAIRRLLTTGPQGSPPSYVSRLRSITGAFSDLGKDRFHAWEYHGPLTAEDIADLATFVGRQDYLDDMPEGIDPLEEVQAQIWFCQGEPIKFALHYLDSGDTIYSVFNLEKDESSIFGFGVPYIMRDPQKALAASWRTLMDNMGLSSGPQIVINEDAIEPANGEWIIEPRKVWRRKTNAPQDMKPFETFNIESHLEDLMAVIELSKRNIDEETALPMLAQGEQGAQVTKTFQGMAILMNSVNVVFRRIVKNWDDDMTEPNITRLYDWLMQFSPKEGIKGDYKVDARGTSVLLVREMQSQNLMLFLDKYPAHPLLGKYLKEEGLPALRRLGQTLLLPSDELIKSDAEIQKDNAKRAEEPPPPNPEMEKIAQSLNLEKMRGQNAMQLEGMRRETALIQLAQSNNMDLEKLRAMLQDNREERQHKERIFAAEAAVEQQRDAAAAARGEKEKGSGGYLS